ncbi:5'-methylthioadenosine/adenosylhomocysteine nucleosidase [Anaerosolibacter sp.]|jgi:adenosylhomocysteine nucleosidase|uniref:5'-methylthioadenosine/adenosylhomocysteine nucleosidase n=1 Tax=Anaerosolibacter sp. TaxID=1872527 RepID=UPI002629C217|nr:5'-methylthioadenosine/adenosylhomocysteine nucleosidase [Anaerosolibacter sp.]MDF2546859.1 5-methylthioadenosine/S-adenosylhomocysteine nucleosidase [Anaerosolibacter sp.]
MNRIGIIGAMDEEVHLLKEKMNLEETIDIAGMTFYSGRLENKDVVIVRCGIGKVNAAVCTQVLISNFDVSSIINTGVAGALKDELEVGDLVISTDVLEHDFDVTGFGYKLGQIPRMDEYIFKSDSKLIEVAEKISKNEQRTHKILTGRILSGDVFVACPERKDLLLREFQGYCTEMEGAAIGHACYLNKIPFVIIRAMSDKADGTAHHNFNEFVHEAAKNSSEIVAGMLKHL